MVFHCIVHQIFSQLFISGQLACFHIFAIVNSTIVNNIDHAIFWVMINFLFLFVQIDPERWNCCITGTFNFSFFKASSEQFLKWIQQFIVYQQYSNFPLFPHPLHHLLEVFLMYAILTDVRWHFIKVLIDISLITGEDEHFFFIDKLVCYISFFENCLLKLTSGLIDWFAYLLLSGMSSLYI